MTKEEIIQMAKQADFLDYELDDGTTNAFDVRYEAFAKLVARHEREACAKVCDDKVDAEYATGKVDHNEMGWTQSCAIAIRARGEA